MTANQRLIRRYLHRLSQRIASGRKWNTSKYGVDMAPMSPIQEAAYTKLEMGKRISDGILASRWVMGGDVDALRHRFAGCGLRPVHVPGPLPEPGKDAILLGWLTPVPKGITIQRPAIRSRAITPDEIEPKGPGRGNTRARILGARARPSTGWYEKSIKAHEEAVEARLVRMSLRPSQGTYTARRCISRL